MSETQSHSKGRPLLFRVLRCNPQEEASLPQMEDAS